MILLLFVLCFAISDLFTFDGGEDTFKDDSLVHWDDFDGDGAISVGDDLLWLIKISDVASSGVNSVDTNGRFIVFMLAATVDDTFQFDGRDGFYLKPNPEVLASVLDPEFAKRIEPDSFGISISAKPTRRFFTELNPVLLTPYYDLSSLSATNYQWDLTLSGGNFGLLFDSLGYKVRGSFNVFDSAFTVGAWVPVDVLSADGETRQGDFTLEGYIGSPASQDEQDRLWNFVGYNDFIGNPK